MVRKTEGCETILYAMSVRGSKLLGNFFSREAAAFSNDSAGGPAIGRPGTFLHGSEEGTEEEEGCCVACLIRSSSSESKAEVGVVSAEIFEVASNCKAT